VRSILLLGFLMGVRHALEADHLAAVASLATRSRSTGSILLQGTAWGLGHTITLLLLGGACLLVGAVIPDALAHALELGVGLMLLLLGGQVFWRLRRQRVHVHLHRHADGTAHLHAHSHPPGQPHRQAGHDHDGHAHPRRLPRRALLVGMVHGMAGSAALLLVTLTAVASPWVGLAHVALFGAGSILGMAVLSAIIAVPLRVSARMLSAVPVGAEAVIGCATLLIGGRVLYEAGALLGALR